MSSELLNVKQAAGLFEVSTQTIGRWIRAGYLPATKMPGATGSWVLQRSDVEALKLAGPPLPGRWPKTSDAA